MFSLGPPAGYKRSQEWREKVTGSFEERVLAMCTFSVHETEQEHTWREDNTCDCGLEKI